MRAYFSRFKPVEFHGEDAVAWARKAATRDLAFLRISTMLIAVSVGSRIVVDWTMAPAALIASLPYRSGALASIGLLFAASFHRAMIPWFHYAVAAGYSMVMIMVALGSSLPSAMYPYATSGVWMVIFMLGFYSFCRRLVIVVLVQTALLPATALLLTGIDQQALWHSLPVLLPFEIIVSLGALLASWCLDRYWRRSFRMERELDASHVRQQRTIQELQDAYATLSRTQAQLGRAEKTAALGRVVAQVAHQLNTPIGNVVVGASHVGEVVASFSRKMATDTIRRADLTAFLDAIGEANHLVLNSAQRAASLVDAFKRLVADAGEAPGPVDAGDLLAHLRPALDAMMTPGLTLLLDVEAGDVGAGLVIRGQRHLLEVVIEELVRNAVRHAFPGGRDGTVSLRVRAGAEGEVVLAVADDGCGIAHNHLEYVFDPFYTDGKLVSSHGLGLSIVHNTVAGPLAGRIAMDSQEGQGTVFTVYLPACPAPAPAPG
jgi:signal transduction histidine kinase